MKSTRRQALYGLAFLLILILLVYAVILFLSRPKKTIPTPLPEIQNESLPNQNQQNENTTNTSFEVVSVEPPQNEQITHLPIVKIELTFNNLINPKTFFYTVAPNTETYIITTRNTVSIFPKLIWNQGTTTITLLPTTTDALGNKLNEPYVYKFNSQVPEDPPEEFEIQ